MVYTTPTAFVSLSTFSKTKGDTQLIDNIAYLGNTHKHSGVEGEGAGTLTVANGSVAAPSYAFLNSTGSGMYRVAANSIALATAGVIRMGIDTTQVRIDMPFASTPASQVLGGNGQTITLPTAGWTKDLGQTAGPYTGIILTSGALNGQLLVLFNSSNASITFAASGTSHVANGVTCVIRTLESAWFVWHSGYVLWFPVAR